jgi:hypothetical protein
MDAAQSTFETAIKDLKGGEPTLRDPGKLGPWMRGIAKHRCQEVWRQRNREGEFPDQDLEDAEHEVKASRRRQAQVDRMLDVVAASLTTRQERIYRLVLRQNIRGQALAADLGISEKEANDATYENQGLLADGFGAYVLALDGRRYCANLDRILDQASWDGTTFTRVLRLRVLRHLDNCPRLCDNCPTCNPQKWKLIATYTPVTIPILIAAELRDRIYQLIHRICTPAGPADPGQPGPNAQAAASATVGSVSEATLDAAITQITSGRSGASDAHVGRLQALVQSASQSNRLPRWLRRAIPHDAGPGMSIAIVATAITAIVVTVAAIAAIATALTSSSAAAGSACSFVVEHTTSCESTNPKVQVYGFFNANARRCTFVRDIDWGDGENSDNVIIPGGPPGPKYEDSHTYSAPGSYAIYFGGHAEGADCNIVAQTFHFKLLPK